MNYNTRLFLICITAVLCILTACKSPQKINSIYAYQSFEIECLGTDLDGTQTLRTWGKGKNKAQAIETAKKNAVRAVMFKGITAGTDECNKRPLINEVNAEEKYEAYFNRFFADGGIYKNFVSLIDEKRNSRLKSSDNSIENWGIVVRVDRASLKERLISDDVINP